MATSPVRREPARGSATTTQRLLVDVEGIPRSGVGALVLERGSRRLGAVLIERGRVCWAVAVRMPRRLSTLLISRAEGLDEKRLARAYGRCRETGQPFGESLVGEGLISAEGLRDALVDHTIDGLTALGADRRGATQRWLSREDRSYDPRFTFSVVELAAEAGAREHRSEAARGRARLAAELPDRVRAASFYRGRDVGRPLLVAHVGLDGETLGTVNALGRWGIATLDLSSAFAGRTAFVTAAHSRGATQVGWTDGALVHVAVCERSASVAKLLGRLSRR